MKTYIVKIKIIIQGQYEKSACHHVEAENDTSAMNIALGAEAHGELTYEDGWWEDEADLNYQVSKIQELTKAETAFLDEFDEFLN